MTKSRFYIRLTAILCAAVFALTAVYGCDEDKDDDELPPELYETVTNVYAAADLGLPEGFNTYSIDIDISASDLYIKGNIYNDPNDIFAGFEQLIIKYNLETNKSEHLPYSYLEQEESLANKIKITLTDGRILLYGTNGFNQSEGRFEYIYIISPDGETEKMIENEYDESARSMFVDSNGNIILVKSWSIVTYDSELNLIDTYETEFSLTDSVMIADDQIIVFNDDGYPYTFDRDARRLVEYDYPELPSGELQEMYLGMDGELYLTDSIGLYIASDDGVTLLCDWVNSGYNPDDVEIVTIIDSDRFVADITNPLWTVADYMSSDTTPELLVRVPDEELKSKVILRVAALDVPEFLYNAITLFNRENETYQVVVDDYSVYFYDESIASPKEQFDRDIMSGYTPALVLVSGMIYANLDTYTDKDFFADLSPYLDETDIDLLGSIESSFASGGAIYTLPVNFRANTLVAKKSTVDNSPLDGSLTLDRLYEIADSLEDGEALFSDTIYSNLLRFASSDFVDYANETVSFDNAEFVRLLEFYSDIGSYTDTSLGRIDTGFGYHQVVGDTLLPAFDEGRLKFINLRMLNLDAYLIMKFMFGDDISLCGYPSNTGGALVEGYYSLAICDRSELKDGAFEFIKFMLSDEVQTSGANTAEGIPVTVSALKQVLGYDEIYVMPEEDRDFITGELSTTFVFYRLREVDENNPYTGGLPHMTLTEADKEAILNFFDQPSSRLTSDNKLWNIIDEEYSAYLGGSITVDEAAERIQNRASIYIAE